MRDGKFLQRDAMWVLAGGRDRRRRLLQATSTTWGRLHGGSGAPVRLLPFSVDMLIVVGELMLLHADQV
jgi:hypothetical protein